MSRAIAFPACILRAAFVERWLEDQEHAGGFCLVFLSRRRAVPVPMMTKLLATRGSLNQSSLEHGQARQTKSSVKIFWTMLG